MPPAAAIIPAMKNAEGHSSDPAHPDANAKSALSALVQEGVATAGATAQSRGAHRQPPPLFDLEHDEQFTALASFSPAVACVSEIEDFRQNYGVGEAKRLVLQFLYEYLDEVPSLVADGHCFESIWTRFDRELSTPTWRHIGITILQNFTSRANRIEIADGVAICRRTLEDTKGAIAQEELNWLMEDWERGAHGSHALLVEHSEPKTPDNVISGDAYHTFNKIERALLALRLAKAGDVRTGRVFYCRPALLPRRLPGRGSSGAAQSRQGTDYHLDEGAIPLVCHRYALLAKFDRTAATWNNIRVALRRFTAIYENDWRQPEDKVIDAMIALEALLGTAQEITYRLASRVAGLLANDDEERVALYKETERWYHRRSKSVHGSDLKPPDREALGTTGELVNIVRRVLLGFLTLATRPSPFNNRSRLSQDIDKVLLHTLERSDLRKAMGLCT